MGKSGQRNRTYSSEFKVRVVLESMQRDTTIEEICRRYGLASSLVNKWRKYFRNNAGQIFEDKRSKSYRNGSGYEPGQSPDELKRIIGNLAVENDILKKASRLLD